MDENNNKNKKNFITAFVKRCPLAMILILSVIVVTAISIVGMTAGNLKNSWGWDHPAMESLLLAGRNDDGGDDTPTQPAESKPAESKPETESTASSAPSGYVIPTWNESEAQPVDQSTASPAPQETDPAESKPAAQPEDPTLDPLKGRQPRSVNYIHTEPITIRSGYYDDPLLKPIGKNYAYVYGDDEYFKDAIFIGDSRVEGLFYYSNLPCDFAFLRGVSIFKIKETSFDLSYGGSALLETVLTAKNYKKIYLLFGLNDLGIKNAEAYGKYYAEAVDWIKQMCPDAVITLMGSMPITKAKSDESDWQNNDNINSRNFWAARYVCDGTEVFYLANDIPELLDETGALSPDCTNDGLHLKAEKYAAWVEHIRTYCYGEDMFNRN